MVRQGQTNGDVCYLELESLNHLHINTSDAHCRLYSIPLPEVYHQLLVFADIGEVVISTPFY